MKKLLAIALGLSLSLSALASNFEETKRLAESGNATAQAELGLMYSLGNVVQKNEAQAIYWYQKAAQQGNADAQVSLGANYSLQGDNSQAIYWWEKAANQGNSLAITFLIGKYKYDRSSNDLTKALYWEEKLATQGDRVYQFLVANDYYLGDGTKPNYDKARYWALKSSQQGSSGASRLIGNLYHQGLGIKKDNNKAIEWYEKSLVQAETNIKLSANLENNVRHATVDAETFGIFSTFSSLADTYTELGEYQKAFSYYLKANQSKDNSTKDSSAFNIASAYFDGKGVRQDYSKAFEWYQKSAATNSSARYNLGIMLLNGQGVRQDYHQAKEWFGKSCDGGDQKGCDQYRILTQKGY